MSASNLRIATPCGGAQLSQQLANFKTGGRWYGEKRESFSSACFQGADF